MEPLRANKAAEGQGGVSRMCADRTASERSVPFSVVDGTQSNVAFQVFQECRSMWVEIRMLAVRVGVLFPTERSGAMSQDRGTSHLPAERRPRRC